MRKEREGGEHLYDTEAGEPTDVDTKLVDVVGFHPFENGFAGFEARIEAEKFGPIWDGVAWEGLVGGWAGGGRRDVPGRVT
jgi:hypothetical protein